MCFEVLTFSVTVGNCTADELAHLKRISNIMKLYITFLQICKDVLKVFSFNYDEDIDELLYIAVFKTENFPLVFFYL